MRVSYLNLGSDDDAFFGKLTAFMRLAARALDVELEVVDCHRYSARIRQEAEALITREPPPDYILTPNHKGLAVNLIPRAEAAGIKVLLINEGLLVTEKSILGHPQEKYSGWLGEIMPGDRQVGYLLADALIREARRRNLRSADGKIHLSALAGSFTIDSISRVSGLRAAVGEHDDVLLEGVLPANWEKERAGELMSQVLTHDPGISVVWSASDYMAMGAIEAVEAAGRKAGRDVIVGGVDWAPFVPSKIREGVLATSIGGHFMNGAWAIVFLYDHHHGADPDLAHATTHQVALTRDSLSKYSVFFDEASWSAIDFARFSKVRNPAAGDGDRSLDAILHALEKDPV